MSTDLKITVKTSQGKQFTTVAQSSWTVLQFKGAIVNDCDVPAAAQRIIFSGRILEDGDTLESCGRREKSMRE